MFARVKKSGNNQYLQIVENSKVSGKVVQRVISTVGRLDRLHEKGDIETLVRSLARFSEKVLLVLSGKNEIGAQTQRIGPPLIFERIWKELGTRKVLEPYPRRQVVFLQCGAGGFSHRFAQAYGVRVGPVL